MNETNTSGFPRVDINVPFSQKDHAKALGARWDPVATTWYVPAGKDSAPFAQWIDCGGEQEQEEPNVKADYFFVAKTQASCWRCKEYVDVYALFLPDGYLGSAYEDEDDLSNNNKLWAEGMGVGALSFVSSVSDEVLAALATHAPGYTRDYSKTTKTYYLMNHCPHCKSSQGDFFLHDGLGSPFFPITDEACKRVEMTPINLRFEAQANDGWSTIEYSKMTYLAGPDGFSARLETQ